MKKGLTLLLAAALLLGGLAGCGPTGISLSGESSSGEAAVSSASAGASESDTSDPLTEEKMVEYALTFARYFRDPIESISSLKDNPHLYEFLVNTVFKIEQDSGATLENISGKDWYEQYLLPNEDLKKAAEILLQTDLPEKIYTNSDFHYVADKDAFLYSPFSPPMFVTNNQGITQHEDGTVSIRIAISKVEQTVAAENIYAFRKVEDSQWGPLFQLLSIQKG